MSIDIFEIIPQVHGTFRDDTIGVRSLPHEHRCRIFISEGHPCISQSEQIDALCIGDLCRTGELSDAKLHMALIPCGLLALSAGIKVFEQTAVHRGVQEIVDGLVEKFSVVRENGDGQQRLYDGAVPVSIGLRIIIPQDRIIGGAHHVPEGILIGGLPSGGTVPQNFCGIAENMSGQAGDEFGVVEIKILQRSRPGIEDGDGLFRISPFSGDLPDQRTMIGHLGSLPEVLSTDVRFSVRPTHHMGSRSDDECRIGNGL